MMKKILLYTVILLTAIGCQVSPLDEEIVDPALDLVSVTLQAQLPAKGEDTRVSVTPSEESAWKTSWEGDETLILLPLYGGESQTLTIETVDKESGIATFKGEVAEGKYEVYTGNIKADGTIDFSNQVASDKCSEMPLKAEEELNVSEDTDFSKTLLYFKHLSQVMELNISLTGVAADYKLHYIEILGKDNEIDYGFGSAKMLFTDKSLTSTTETFKVYCYLPGFTVPANGSVNFSAAITDSNEAPYTITGVATNTTGSDVEFEIGKHNYLNTTLDFSSQTTDKWIDFAAETFANNQAYDANVQDYTIETPEQLALLSKLVNGYGGESQTDMNGKTFTLATNIDLTGKEWTAIGNFKTNPKTPFSGIFDGAGHTVKGIYINRSKTADDSDSDFQALFGYVTTPNISNSAASEITAIIKNVTVSGNITGCRAIGSVVGCANYAKVENCVNEATIEGSFNVGGVVGHAYRNSIITNCVNNGNVINENADSNDNNIAGGVVGYLEGANVVNSYNNGEVKGTYNVGGVVGKSKSSRFDNIDIESYIANSYSLADVNGTAGYVGGIVGYNNESNIINCYNASIVTGTTEQLGSIAGYVSANSNIEDCYYARDKTGFAYGKKENNTSSSVTVMSSSNMQEAKFIATLNNNAAIYNASNAAKAFAWMEDASGVNSGYPVFDFDGVPTYNLATFAGDGTKESPYVISSIADLKNLSLNVNVGEQSYSGKYFVMTSTINLSDVKFTPIGIYDWSNPKAFSGTFNGNNNTISGLNISKADGFYQAIFGCIKGATIENLTVDGKVTAHAYIAGVVAHAEDSKVINCCNKATITATTPIGEKITDHVAGVVAYCKYTPIINCSNSGNISGQGSRVGGITGSTESSYVINCYNTADVRSKGYQVGGVVGITFDGEVVNCYNTGSVLCGKEYAGGVVGQSYSKITNCYSTGSVSGDTKGKIVGYTDVSADVTNCYWATNNVGSSPNYGIGGAEDSPSGLTGASDVGAEPKSTEYMKESEFVVLLNNNASTYNKTSPKVNACGWLSDSETANSGYPMLDFTNTNPTFKQFDDVTGGVEFGK